MKAISLWQPWATAMALGLKTIETRHWTCSHRGLLAIHAAKRWQTDEREWAAALARQHGEPVLANPPLGAIVAVGWLERIVPTSDLLPRISATEESFGNYAPGRFGWIFSKVIGLNEPVPCKGAQGFFELSAEDATLVHNRSHRDDLPAPKSPIGATS